MPGSSLLCEDCLTTASWQTRGEFNGNVWLGFDRFTCVPIQTRMVKESMLTKEEKQWLKVRVYLPETCVLAF